MLRMQLPIWMPGLGHVNMYGLLRRASIQYEPLRIVIWQRPEEDAVDRAEDRGVGANAERERQNGRSGKTGPAKQRSSAWRMSCTTRSSMRSPEAPQIPRERS